MTSRKDAPPAVSYARPFRVGGQTVSVRISAYGAGQGSAALAGLVDRLRSCDGAGTYGTAIGPTSTAVSAWSQTSSSNASSLTWNRADVIASVTVPRSSAAGLAPIAESVDNALLEALDGTCASTDEKVSDIGRSPWSGRTFTGNLTPRAVELAYPDPSSSPTPVLPSGVPTVPVPGPTVYVPKISTLPPHVTPSPTTAPSTSVDVLEQVADPTGPGCGWAFTSQGAPNFDPAAAEAQVTEDIAVAQQQLQAADAAWQLFRSTYAVEYANYVAQAEAFAAYARAQNEY